MRTINNTEEYWAIPYGASSIAPEDPRGQETYFDMLDRANPAHTKRPDILVYRKDMMDEINDEIASLGKSIDIQLDFESDATKLPFINELKMMRMIKKAIFAIECENSLWKAKMMPDFGRQLKPMRRLGGNLGLPKNAKTPTVIIKDEDLGRITEWERSTNIPIHTWQIFYDMAIGLALKQAQRLIDKKHIDATLQKFSEPGGGVTEKSIYKIYHNHCYSVGTIVTEPKLEANAIVDSNGHVLPYVKFVGGKMNLSDEAKTIIAGMACGEGMLGGKIMP